VAVLQKELGVAAQMEVGAPGSFIVLVDGEIVAQKTRDFPTEDEIVQAVRHRLPK
jgi:predicted Rdx family selenoprotein